ncbi:hypothetical protein [Oceanimonas baumannii]|uniref:Uncharacterized protein n=1 Tax=Oceanimonas baumannii TaxID=129578 RepID=A0A235CJT9_9GAMM|nr:hypothetical protein [Oceanimonas baumannii]OYD24716.1 hypothetical protein B6S09_08825 [Oceanimonas baumannii]TDW59463.1 hypothetical protein LY04_01714 [Oceanimonas baumannii]
MTQINTISQVANGYLNEFNKLARQNKAAGMELQTECALEALAEVAHQSGYDALYEQITERKNALWLHAPMASITAGGEV